MDNSSTLDPPRDQALAAGRDSLRVLPGLADGVELLGRYTDSGLRDAPYLIRRGDGQVLQITRLLYLVTSHLDGRRDAGQVALRVSAELGREVSAANVVKLLDKLRPTGLLLQTPGHRPAAPARVNPLLALRLRLPLVPARIHRTVTATLRPLFRPPVVVTVLVGLAVLDFWMVLGPGGDLLEATRQLVYEPYRLLPLSGLIVAMGLFHECGHAAAARYGGATPGAMGAGIYLVWPVFYTDVTDAYRLDRRGRLRTDLGGVYFNAIFMLGAAALYAATGDGFLLVFLLVAQAETLRQFLPFVRLDGYHIVGDLAGVPNPFAYLGPTLRGVVRYFRGNPRHAPGTRQLGRLTPRARFILTVWACATLSILLINVVVLLVFALHVAGMMWGSAQRQVDALSVAGGAGGAGEGAGPAGVLRAALGLTLLMLPVIGGSYLAGRLIRRLGSALRRVWRGRPLLTASASLAVLTALVAQTVLVWPDQFAAAVRRADLAAEVGPHSDG